MPVIFQCCMIPLDKVTCPIWLEFIVLLECMIIRRWLSAFSHERYLGHPPRASSNSFFNSIHKAYNLKTPGNLGSVCVIRSVVPDSLRPMDCSPPGSSLHWILQARILACFASSFFKGSSWPMDQIWVSCIAGRCFTFWVRQDNKHLACCLDLASP